MSVSHRNRRTLVLEYVDAGSEGSVDSAYQAIDSGDSDKRWWCAFMTPTGREVTTGMQPDHRVDAVLVFAGEVPVHVDHALLLDDGEGYLVRAVLPRAYGRDETLVYAERTAELTLST